jgi:AcrR family transcriptional regulator
MTKPTTARSGRLPADEAAQIPDRLLDAATELFTRAGYGKTTMEAIARQAGASSKTVYSRFANKEEILAALVRRLMDRALDPETPLIAPETGAEDPRAFLLRIGHELANLSEARETAGLNRLIMAEAFQFPDLANLFIDLHDRATSVIREPIERWTTEGRLGNVPDARLASIIFIEMVASVPRIRALLGRPLPRQETEALVAAAVDIFLNGCGYHSKASAPK